MEPVIYRQAGLPLFQNKVYATREEALKAEVGDVELVQCASSGLIRNRLFQPGLLDYDEAYQNEQACSGAFRRHLDEVSTLIVGHFGQRARAVEIGCGKGYFLELLARAGVDVVGYDPAYEGDRPEIRKQYFRGGSEAAEADYLILRHVLEHIADPWNFLVDLVAECGPACGVYIEVPCFEWIVAHRAFYDIFYEHCNYFTLDVLRNAFGRVEASGKLFGNQYLYVLADLSSFRAPLEYRGRRFSALQLENALGEIMRGCIPGRPTYIWGAGAKGITFANLLARKGAALDALLDINPAKQGRFAGLSGLPILAPETAGERLRGSNIVVMNPIYLQEIADAVSHLGPNLMSVA